VNRKQHISIALGITAALLIGVFPRWEGYSQLTYNEYKEIGPVKFKRMGYKIDPNVINPAILDLAPSAFPMYFQKTKYRFILTPPEPEVYSDLGPKGETIARYRIDLGTLVARWIIVAFVTFGMMYSFKNEKIVSINQKEALDTFLNHIKTRSNEPRV
jgi:hypothetical protein